MIFLRTTLPFLILSFFLLILHAPPSSATNTSDIDFIRQSCNVTLYPDICYHSLSRYASAVSQDPAKLATVAIGVSLSHARHAASYFSNLTRNSSAHHCDRRAAAAVQDCSSMFSEAVSQMRGSLALMRKLPARASEEIRFQLSSVQTWMSAALTYEDTCTDGFDGVQSDLPLKTDVCDRVNKVMKFTSNALALVNRYAISTVN